MQTFKPHNPRHYSDRLEYLRGGRFFSTRAKGGLLFKVLCARCGDPLGMHGLVDDECMGVYSDVV